MHEEVCKQMKLDDTIQEQRSDQRKLEDDIAALKDEAFHEISLLVSDLSKLRNYHKDLTLNFR